MIVESVHPPNSTEVICAVESEAVPSIHDCVNISGKEYRVFTVEWHIFTDRDYNDPNRMGVIVNLIDAKMNLSDQFGITKKEVK